MLHAHYQQSNGAGGGRGGCGVGGGCGSSGGVGSGGGGGGGGGSGDFGCRSCGGGGKVSMCASPKRRTGDKTEVIRRKIGGDQQSIEV